jgi:hypothetical protein
MVPPWAQFLLFGRRLSWDCFWCWQARVDTILLACVRTAAAAVASFRLLQPRQLAVWLSPQLQHSSCSFEAAQFPDGCASPQATHLGAQAQLRWVCSKRWQRLHCNVPFGALYEQAAEIGERPYIRHIRASRHRHDKVRC